MLHAQQSVAGDHRPCLRSLSLRRPFRRFTNFNPLSQKARKRPCLCNQHIRSQARPHSFTEPEPYVVSYLLMDTAAQEEQFGSVLVECRMRSTPLKAMLPTGLPARCWSLNALCKLVCAKLHRRIVYWKPHQCSVVSDLQELLLHRICFCKVVHPNTA